MARTKKVPVTKGKQKSGRSKNVIVNSSKKGRQEHNFRQEIKKYQNSVKHLIPKAPFARLVRKLIEEEIAGGYYQHLTPHSFRVTPTFLECLLEASEVYLTTYFEDLNLLARHATRVTVMVKDLETLRNIKRTDHNLSKR